MPGEVYIYIMYTTYDTTNYKNQYATTVLKHCKSVIYIGLFRSHVKNHTTFWPFRTLTVFK